MMEKSFRQSGVSTKQTFLKMNVKTLLPGTEMLKKYLCRMRQNKGEAEHVRGWKPKRGFDIWRMRFSFREG